MDKYFNSFQEMISLRGLTDHTLKSYCTYIHAYLDYLENTLHKFPEDITWAEQREFVRWLSTNKFLSDRTINCAISQLHFFTFYVLHKPLGSFFQKQWLTYKKCSYPPSINSSICSSMQAAISPF